MTETATPTATDTLTPTPTCTDGPTSTPWSCLGEEDDFDNTYEYLSVYTSGAGGELIRDTDIKLQGDAAMQISPFDIGETLVGKAYSVVPGHAYRCTFFCSTTDYGNNYLIYGALDAECNAAFEPNFGLLNEWGGWSAASVWYSRAFEFTPERSVMVIYLGAGAEVNPVWIDYLTVVDLDGAICTPTPTWTPLFTRTPTPTATSHPIDPMNEMKYQPWHDWILRGIF